MSTTDEYQQRIAQLEAELSDTRRMMQDILDHIPVRVFWKDRDLRYLGCNRLFAADAGLESPHDIVGKDDYELSWAQVAELYRADDQAVIDSGEARLNFEEPQNREDGTKSWLRTTKTPLWDVAGSIYGVLGMYEDITQRKQEEEALCLREEQYRLMIENVTDVIYRSGADGKYTFVSPSVQKMLGYEPEELIGKVTFFDLIHPDDIQRLNTDKQALHVLDKMSAEARYRRKDGSYIWIEGTLHFLRDAQTEQQAGYVGIIRDVTERKRSEQKIRQQQSFIRQVMDAAPILIGVKDWDGHFQFANKTLADIYGTTAEDMVGKTDADFNPNQAEVAQYLEADRMVMRSKQRLLIPEEQITSASGEVQWLQTIKIPLQDEDGNLQVLLVASDITERKQTEIERDQLQKQVIEAQRQALAELSTPIIPIMDRIIVMPLVGAIDSARSRDIMRSLLEGISQYRAQIAILDITGVPVVDSGVADHLNRTMQAARLKGAQTIITGVSDAVAETIVDLGIDWSGFETLRDLQTGLVTALERVGFHLARSWKGKK